MERTNTFLDSWNTSNHLKITSIKMRFSQQKSLSKDTYNFSFNILFPIYIIKWFAFRSPISTLDRWSINRFIINYLSHQDELPNWDSPNIFPFFSSLWNESYEFPKFNQFVKYSKGLNTFLMYEAWHSLLPGSGDTQTQPHVLLHRLDTTPGLRQLQVMLDSFSRRRFTARIGRPSFQALVWRETVRPRYDIARDVYYSITVTICFS